MRKRLLLGLLISVMAGTFTGCASSVTLTDKQSDLVAEYVSSVMLKYSQKASSNKLVKLEEAEATEAPTLAPTATETPAATEHNQTTVTNTSNEQNTQEEAIADVTKTTMEKLYGLTDVSITYNNVKEYKTYPKDSEEAITATDGHKFLVVSFKLTNHSDKDVKIDLLKKAVNFSLQADGIWIPNAHTLLSNDMTYYQGKIKANKSTEAVVLFEVEDSFQLSSATFYAFSDSKKACEVTIK